MDTQTSFGLARGDNIENVENVSSPCTATQHHFTMQCNVSIERSPFFGDTEHSQDIHFNVLMDTFCSRDVPSDYYN